MIIMVGISGSGKSTRAKVLASQNQNSIICSADDFFYDSEGVYRFNPKLLGFNHKQCQDLCKHSMEFGTELVIVDNTNLTKQEREPYKVLANEFGYVIKEEFVECDIETAVKRNLHNVPEHSIRRMAARLER